MSFKGQYIRIQLEKNPKRSVDVQLNRYIISGFKDVDIVFAETSKTDCIAVSMESERESGIYEWNLVLSIC